MIFPFMHKPASFSWGFPQLLRAFLWTFLVLWISIPQTILAVDNPTAADPIVTADSSDSIPLSEEEWGQLAFLQFFGEDGVNECLEEPSAEDNLPLGSGPAIYSGKQAILTTSWENVGGGRINRKYLNGLIAFCFDEELSFPNGASYIYATASSAAITSQAAAIAKRFGDSGIDNAQWWSQCQVAIWAVRAGCTTRDSAAAFARSYCADRKISDPDTIADYAYIVGALVAETSGQSGTAYLYQAEDPANQRIMTFTAIWPDPAPSYPSPQYDSVQAAASHTLSRTLSLSIDHKYSSITEEPLKGAVFQIDQGDTPVGTITTDSQGKGTFTWTIFEQASAQSSMTYCSNYEYLDPKTREEIRGYTNRQDAYEAAYDQALAQATAQAQQAIAAPQQITVKETHVPTGFSLSGESTYSIVLTDQDHTSLSISNTPWQAAFQIEKSDSITGEPILSPAAFILYEWNGTDYQISPHYEVIRRNDGIYTVSSNYPQGQKGILYYTQENQGKFALQEIEAPLGYYLDSELSYYTITQDGMTLYGHNASHPNDCQDSSCDEVHDHTTKFFNTPRPQPQYDQIFVTVYQTATRTHEVILDKKTALITGESVSGAVFEVYEKNQLVGTITTNDQGTGSCQWELSETASATVTLDYCTNYEELETEEKALVNVYTSKEDAIAAATQQASIQASEAAQALAELPQEVTIRETSAPTGFLVSAQSSITLSLAGNDCAVFSAENLPWQASFSLTKINGNSGETISSPATFHLYEWNGTDYQISSNYEVIRLEDGTYTVSCQYPDTPQGILYYSQTNQGLFALEEIMAPAGYLADPQWFYFQIEAPDQVIYGHNADPSVFSYGSDLVFANLPCPEEPVPPTPPQPDITYGADTGDRHHPLLWAVWTGLSVFVISWSWLQRKFNH